jgi:hypothetical protein
LAPRSGKWARTGEDFQNFYWSNLINKANGQNDSTLEVLLREEHVLPRKYLLKVVVELPLRRNIVAAIKIGSTIDTFITVTTGTQRL